VTGPAGAFELIKTCGVYALLVVSGTALAAFGASPKRGDGRCRKEINAA